MPEVIRPGLIRVLAPNPSPMTERGTNSYVLGGAGVCVIDPGPDMPAHLQALLTVIGGRPVSHIIVTHSHLDHSALAPRLSGITGAPVLAFGAAGTGRSSVMTALAEAGLQGGGEGIDSTFHPDIPLPDGAVIAGADWQLGVIHTPGHLGNHICLGWHDAVFSGDHAMGWASSLVSPPDGDLTDYMASCDRLLGLGPACLFPGHGPMVKDAKARLTAIIVHRRAREGQIMQTLTRGRANVATITAAIYTDTPPALRPAARRNVLAHLVDLHQRKLVDANPGLINDAVFQLP